MSHYINELVFGEDMTQLGIEGSFNTLAGTDKTKVSSIESHEYHMKIVPTLYEDNFHNRVGSYQYTAAYKNFISIHHTGRMIPAIWFRYDRHNSRDTESTCRTPSLDSAARASGRHTKPASLYSPARISDT